MTQHINLDPGEPVPEGFWDAIQELLSGIEVNLDFGITDNAGNPGASAVRLPAGAGHGQASVSIGGQYRWVTASIVRPHPGGAAGTYDLHVTSQSNVADTGVPPAGDYSFGLAITPTGVPPAGVDRYRRVRTLEWDGSKIARLEPLTIERRALRLARDARDPLPGLPPIGAQIPYAGAGDPPNDDWLLADGRLVLKATYPAYFASVGHRYNLGVDPGGGMCRLPDKRGRVSLGADNMGTAAGAANRLPSSVRAQGEAGGEERHQLTDPELANHAHSVIDPGHATQISRVKFLGPGPDGTPDHRHNENPGYLSEAPRADPYVGQAAPVFTDDADTGISLGTFGSDTPHNNLQPYQVDNMIVRVA